MIDKLGGIDVPLNIQTSRNLDYVVGGVADLASPSGSSLKAQPLALPLEPIPVISHHQAHHLMHD